MVRKTRDEPSSTGVWPRHAAGNSFRVLVVADYLGRTFDGSADGTIGGSPHVVISYGFWKRRFGADTSVIGQRILISAAGYPVTVIGVTPSWFTGEIVGSSIDMWIPVTMQSTLQPAQPMLDDRGASWLLLFGRRKAGVTIEQARAQLGPVLLRSIVDHPIPGESFDTTRALFIGSGARG